jgi:hypothetical protein
MTGVFMDQIESLHIMSIDTLNEASRCTISPSNMRIGMRIEFLETYTGAGT